MGIQARSLIGIRFLHPAKVKTNLASALSLNENVGKNRRFLAMAAYSSKLDTLLIWLNENVLQGKNLRGSYLRHPPVKKHTKKFC